MHAAVERDPILSTVYCLILNGWPEKVHEVPRIAQQFWGAKDKLSVEEGLLIKRDRICIPLNSMTDPKQSTPQSSARY